MQSSAITSNRSFCFLAGRQLKVWLPALGLIVMGCAVWLGGHNRHSEPRTDDATSHAIALPALRGAAATQYLKERGLYASLQAAVKAAPYQVRRANQVEPAGQRGPQPAPHELEAYEARNPAHHFAARFTADSLQLQSGAAAQSWRLALTLRSAGYGARAIALTPGEVKAANNCVEIRHESPIANRQSPITEWYVNDPAGLEHGFTLAAAPPVARNGERLRLAMALSGDLQAQAAADGQSVLLRNQRGEQVMSYGGLVVKDATGRKLEAHLTAAVGEIAIEVDDAAATYPLVIDPTFVQQQKLTASDGDGFDFFGGAVALSGDTALVGASGAGTNDSAAYVFVRSGATWTFQQQLTVAGAAVNDFFGGAVALDGDTALIGASGDDIGLAADRGSAYVFVRMGTNWSQQAMLTAADGAANNSFGGSVALDGDTALVGAAGDDSGNAINRGSAYVFVRSGVNWAQQQKLTASDGAANDQFGNAVSLSGDTALVGARYDDVGGNTNQGSAYVFVRTGANWAQQQKLTASDGEVDLRFGEAVALDGDTALVGADGDNISPNQEQGSAYVFVRSGTVWSEQQKLTASDADDFDSFGDAVALVGDTALIGAPFDDVGAINNRGAAYVFTRSGTTWSQRQKLTATDGEINDVFGVSVALGNDAAIIGASGVDMPNVSQGAAYVFSGSSAYPQQAQLIPGDGAADDFLGVSVAISGDTVLVGAPEDDIGADEDQGSVYVFVRTGTNWTQQQEINAADGGERDLFGWSVSLSGNTALIGAFGDDIGGAANRGSAYVYVRSGTNWSQQVKLTASDGAAGDAFGFSVAVSGNTALVGAYSADVAQGAAYVFTRSGTAWSQQQKLSGSDSVAGDQFGYAVSLSGNTALVGAPSDDVGLDTNQGSAYVFTRFGVAWSQQAKLTASDGLADDQFGNSVSLSGDRALIGAHLNDPLPGDIFNPERGAAYIFGRSGATWSQLQKLLASNGAAADEFGYAVGLSGNVAVVGAPYRQVGADVNQGAAYIFNNCPGAITVNPAALPAGQINVVYNQALSASGGFAPYTFNIIAGALPANVTLSAAGLLSGVPTQSGVFNFVVQAVDQNGCTRSRLYALTINPCPAITINPIALATGTVGAAYNQLLTTSGGASPYVLMVIAGALPPGLSLSAGGILLGVPTQAGAFNFTIRATDANGCTGTRAYTVTVNSAPPVVRARKGDFDGDGQTDLVVWRPSEGNWYVRRSTDGSFYVQQWGLNSDLTVPGDYDGDQRIDIAVWRPSEGNWYVIRSSDNAIIVQQWGLPGDVPVPGDYDNDGRTDFAVWRGSEGRWYVRSANNIVAIQQWGLPGDMPVASDYDGDRQTDLAVWRPAEGNWYVIRSSDGAVVVQQWGLPGDVPAPGDYDGDDRADFTVWRGTEGNWYVIRSSTGAQQTTAWGSALFNDITVPGDYDGDGLTDLAVWRPAEGNWYVIRSTDGTHFIQQWGLNGDTPVPATGVR